MQPLIAAVCALPLLLAKVSEQAPNRLPADGVWVRYHVVSKGDDGPEVVWKSTLKLLGRADNKGQSCRWIEIEEQYEEPPSHVVHKILIPESALLESERPLDEAVKYVTKTNDSDVVSGDPQFARLFGTSLLFLPATMKQAIRIDEPTIVDYQHGQLTIPTASAGEYSWSRRAKTIDQTQTYVWQYTVWLHPKLPVGFAHAKAKFAIRIDDTTRRTADEEWFLEDTGTGARSALLDIAASAP